MDNFEELNFYVMFAPIATKGSINKLRVCTFGTKNNAFL